MVFPTACQKRPLQRVALIVAASAAASWAGSAAASPQALSSTQPASLDSPPSESQTAQLAQDREPSVGRPTQSGSSYIGVGGNIGLGDSGLGDGGFALNSKIGLTQQLSLRPALLFNDGFDNATVTLPLTYDFPLRTGTPGNQPVAYGPYLGGGAFFTGDDESSSDAGLLLTGGIDVPLSSRFTANAAVNIGFGDDTEAGILVGVGYNFTNGTR